MIRAFSIFLAVIVAIIDPQNALNLRPILLMAAGVIWFLGISRAFPIANIKDIALLIFTYVLPIYGVVLYLIRGNGSALTDTSYISTALIVSLGYFLGVGKNKLYLKISIILAAYLFILIYVLLLLEYLGGGDYGVTRFLIENEVARVSYREYAGIDFPYLYVYTSSFLMVPLSLYYTEIHSSKDSKLIIYILLCCMLFISGTRSHMLLSMGFGLMMIAKLNKKIFLSFLPIILFFGMFYFVDVAAEFFDKNEESNSYKLKMLGGYFEIYDNWYNIIFGQGFQAIDWDSTLRSMVAESTAAVKTELTLLEIVRVYGAFLGLSTIIILIATMLHVKSGAIKMQKIIILGLFIDGISNPHIFSTYGGMMLAISLTDLSVRYGKNHTYSNDSKAI